MLLFTPTSLSKPRFLAVDSEGFIIVRGGVTNMSDSGLLNGTLFVGESAEENEHIEDGETLYSDAVFVSGSIAIQFKDGTSGYYPVTEDAFTDSYGDTLFYPYYNETTARATMAVDTRDYTVRRDDIAVRYFETDGSLFIQSQNTVTAYAPNYLVVDDTVYKAHDPLLVSEHSDAEADEFLGTDAVENPIFVENMETNARVPLPDEHVRGLVENDEPNGALEIRGPKNPMREVRDSLHDD